MWKLLSVSYLDIVSGIMHYNTENSLHHKGLYKVSVVLGLGKNDVADMHDFIAFSLFLDSSFHSQPFC